MKGQMKGIVVGSYRRGGESSGDIDVLLTLPESDPELFSSYIDSLKKSGYMVEVLSQGDQKCLSIVKLKADGKNRRLDLLVVPKEEFPFALLYFTGSGDFNIAFRKHALKLGYTLNEHELKPVKDDVKHVPPFKYEAQIFKFLGLEYKEPNQRIGPTSVVELTSNTKEKIRAAKTRKNKK
jgi:DNA polymerase beta